jgi:phosphopantothenoylcysteine decarboxylase/phosphopantothenate--cysteine ligase
MLVTAGPTHERIDAVRYLGNRSSGRMGIAVAEAAAQAGWGVDLLLGPACIAPPAAVRVARFGSTTELDQLLIEHFPACDVLVMAAAVADYRPARPRSSKIERGAGRLLLELEPTADLVAGCAARRRAGQRIVGFALEEPHLLETRALEKLRSKRLDAIVANPLESIESDQISATVYTTQGAFRPGGAVGSVGAVKPGDALGPGGAVEVGGAVGPGGAERSIAKPEFARWLVGWITNQWFPRADGMSALR